MIEVFLQNTFVCFFIPTAPCPAHAGVVAAGYVGFAFQVIGTRYTRGAAIAVTINVQCLTYFCELSVARVPLIQTAFPEKSKVSPCQIEIFFREMKVLL